MYARPSNLDDALGLLAESGARVIAGGTDKFTPVPASVPCKPIS